MKVYADIRQKVDVDPIDVIEKLIEKEIGHSGWVFIEDDKYYEGYVISAGCHSMDEKEEITKEKYDYVISLQHCLDYLKKCKNSN